MDDHRDRKLIKRVEVLERIVRNQGTLLFFTLIACCLLARALFAKGILAGRDLVPDG